MAKKQAKKVVKVVKVIKVVKKVAAPKKKKPVSKPKKVVSKEIVEAPTTAIANTSKSESNTQFSVTPATNSSMNSEPIVIKEGLNKAADESNSNIVKPELKTETPPTTTATIPATTPMPATNNPTVTTPSNTNATTVTAQPATTTAQSSGTNPNFIVAQPVVDHSNKKHWILVALISVILIILSLAAYYLIAGI